LKSRIEARLQDWRETAEARRPSRARADCPAQFGEKLRSHTVLRRAGPQAGGLASSAQTRNLGRSLATRRAMNRPGFIRAEKCNAARLCHPTAPHRKLRAPEWFVSSLMMDRALDAVVRRVKHP
jgi:hypothetical protein